MMSRPRLVHVTTTDMSLSQLLGAQLQAFAAAGYEVIGVSAPGPYVEDLRSWGIEHRPLWSASRAFNPLGDLRAFRELVSLLRELRPDVVHTHNPKPGVYGRAAARRVGVPAVVNTVHGLYAVPEDRWSKRALVYSLERLAAACSDVELVQNIEDFECLARLGVPRSRLHLLGNGIDLRRFDGRLVRRRRRVMARASLGIGADEVVCGVVGRLVWEKGYREIFAAARRLREVAPGVRFIVAGSAEPAKRDAVSEKSIQEAQRQGVQFLGPRRDMQDLYAAFDLYALASYREGVPRSAMEAAAMGLPVVATDVRGCRQVVEDGKTGRLVPVRDAGALADAIIDVALDSEQRCRMGRAGWAKARREFDEDRVIALTLDVYARLLGWGRLSTDQGPAPSSRTAG
jgi:glycosyltransferase involved in cell wall biosynthesis